LGRAFFGREEEPLFGSLARGEKSGANLACHCGGRKVQCCDRETVEETRGGISEKRQEVPQEKVRKRKKGRANYAEGPGFGGDPQVKPTWLGAGGECRGHGID